MRFLLGMGTVFLVILAVKLLAVFMEGHIRSRFRVVHAGEKYVIQYRLGLLWKTYYIPGTGEPAVYYNLPEAEAFVKELVERGTKAAFKKTRKSTVYEYNDNGTRIGSKKR